VTLPCCSDRGERTPATISRSRDAGQSGDLSTGNIERMFLRLFSRAPRTSMLPNREPIKLVGVLAARSAGFRLALALEIKRHCGADEMLQRRLIDLVAFVDVDGAPDIPVEAGVE